MEQIQSWDEIPDFDNEDEEVDFWDTHDASVLFGYLPWWRRARLAITGAFWYAVGYCEGLFKRR